MRLTELMAGDRIRDPSGKAFVVVDVANGVAVLSRTQIATSLEGWVMIQRVSETGEVERLRAELERLKAELESTK